MKPQTLTLPILFIFFVLCHAATHAQIRIDALTIIKPNTLVTVVSSGTPTMTITDSLLNQGFLDINSTNVIVGGTNGVLRNEDSLSIDGFLSSQGRPIVNATGPGGFFAVTGTVTINGNGSLQNLSPSDTFHTSQDLILNNTAQLINLGGVFNVDNNLTTSTTTNIINQGFLRIAGNYNNQGGYGALSDNGTIRLVGSNAATFSNGSNPVYHLWLNATGTKTLSSNTTISNRLSLFNGVLQTTPSISIDLDSVATITRPSAFNPSTGGHVEGTMRRYVEHIAVTDQLDSLFFPMGIGPNYAPFLIREMSAQGPNALFSVTTSDPGSPSPNSFDVNPPLNSDIAWGLDFVNKPDSFKIQALAPISLIGNVSTDSLIVAQSNAATGNTFESLGKGGAFSSTTMRGITSEYQPDLPFIALGVSRNTKLSLKVLLQGRINGVTMDTDSAFTDTLIDRFEDRIIEAYRPIPINVIDSISVSIRVATSSPDIETIPAWLMADGSIRDFRTITDTSITFAKALDTSYYIVVRHRNHLTLMSSSPVSLVSNSRGQTDLTQISNIYGGGVFAVTGAIGAMYAGNTRNIDQEVNAGDQFDAVFGNANLLTGYDRRDADLNAVINAADITITDEGSFSLYFSTTP